MKKVRRLLILLIFSLLFVSCNKPGIDTISNINHSSLSLDESSQETGNSEQETSDGSSENEISSVISTQASSLISESSSAPTSSQPADQDKPKDSRLLYGICYVQPQMQGLIYGFDYRVDNRQVIDMMKALGVQSIRAWNISWFMMSDYKTIIKSKAKPYHDFYAQLKAAGIDTIIGVSHYWYLPDSNTGTITVPLRDTAPGSNYMKFLNQYEVMWKTLAAEFPEIGYWEMGNEQNSDAFLMALKSERPDQKLTLLEKADITTDMMFYASRGIKAGNSKAVTIMPGMAPVDGIDGKQLIDYLERIYSNIKSGSFGNGSKNTNDYFEALCWHTYDAKLIDGIGWVWQKPTQAWVDMNNKVYAIAKKYGDDGKKVYLTESGFSDGGNAEEDKKQGPWVTEMYRLVKEKMPYVQTMFYYRMFNDGPNDQYGLFNEPVNKIFSPKAKAFGFQAAAGGKGDLNLYQK